MVEVKVARYKFILRMNGKENTLWKVWFVIYYNYKYNNKTKKKRNWTVGSKLKTSKTNSKKFGNLLELAGCTFAMLFNLGSILNIFVALSAVCILIISLTILSPHL